MKKPHQMEVMPQMCATCPFRPGSPHADLKPIIELSLMDVSRICHSTGNNPVIKRVKVPAKLCRGARNIQLETFHAIGFLPEATDEAWLAKYKSLEQQK